MTFVFWGSVFLGWPKNPKCATPLEVVGFTTFLNGETPFLNDDQPLPPKNGGSMDFQGFRNLQGESSKKLLPKKTRGKTSSFHPTEMDHSLSCRNLSVYEKSLWGKTLCWKNRALIKIWRIRLSGKSTRINFGISLKIMQGGAPTSYK